MTMEYVSGWNLRSFRPSCGNRPDISLLILPFLLYPEYAGLAYAHRKKDKKEDLWGLCIEMNPKTS